MKKEYRRKLLNFRVILLFVCIGFILDIIMLGISYIVYTENMNSSYGKVCIGVTQVVASNIDGDDVDKWLQGNEMEHYYSIKQTLARIRNTVADVENVYVYDMNPDGMKVVFDVNTTGLEKIKLGSVLEYPHKWDEYKDALMDGRKIETMVTDEGKNWLLTAVKPILNAKGECVCYAGCDISMARVSADRKNFMLQLALPISIATVIIILLGILYLLKHIVHPINRLDVYSRNFAVDNSKKLVVKEKLQSLKIDTGKEINSLREDLISLIDNINDYTNEVATLKDNVINGIATMIDNKTESSQEHPKLMEKYVSIILGELRKKEKYQKLIDETMANNIVRAIPIYDIGEISVSDKILKKPGKLTNEEYETVKSHTTSGGEMIVEAIKDTQDEQYTNLAKEIAEFHHEHWDGSGYPNGLQGTDIPLSARIVAVPDVFNALISKRVYKDQISVSEAFDIIQKGSGTQFDADVVEAFMAGRSAIEKAIIKSEKKKNTVEETK